ncbi:MAG: hypothetical protein IPH34_04300 [Chitinophagaceae bacterium]|nr:hypothetical protein [Chitinophagaceae bacterium]
MRSPTTVHRFQYCFVSTAFWFAEINAGNDFSISSKTQHIWQQPFCLGASSNAVGSVLEISSSKQYL